MIESGRDSWYSLVVQNKEEDNDEISHTDQFVFANL